MSLVSWMVKGYTKTIAKWKAPASHKLFDLSHYFKIEEMLKEHKVAIILVTTYGAGSNIGIRFAQSLGTKHSSKKTHAILFLGVEGENRYRAMAVEAVEKGIQKVTMLQAIGQRDEVMVRVPNPHLVNSMVQEYMVEYAKEVVRRDSEGNIEYDNDHDLSTESTYDCSELIYHTLMYGFKKARHTVLVKPVERAGKKTFTPLDLEFSELFETVYDDGFISREE